MYLNVALTSDMQWSHVGSYHVQWADGSEALINILLHDRQLVGVGFGSIDQEHLSYSSWGGFETTINPFGWVCR